LAYQYLDFEQPIADLDGKILELKAAEGGEANLANEIKRLEKRSAETLADLYKALTPWQKAQVARHPDRPHCKDYIEALITEFSPLAGDRKFAEDAAIIAGVGRFNGMPVAVIGQEKGADTASRLKHNFGMAKPEGYRKAVRVMELADRFGLPVITFVDTAGAYPGLDAEARGQAEAIARATQTCLSSAKAAQAVPLPSPQPTASSCWSIRSIRSSRRKVPRPSCGMMRRAPRMQPSP
jgi:acetyl-CoA carboxylase carboxyl transferase subunit alpha